MICSRFKISDVPSAVLEASDLLRMELKGDNLRACDTHWDEILLAMSYVAEEYDLEGLYSRQLGKSDLRDHVRRGQTSRQADKEKTK